MVSTGADPRGSCRIGVVGRPGRLIALRRSRVVAGVALAAALLAGGGIPALHALLHAREAADDGAIVAAHAHTHAAGALAARHFAPATRVAAPPHSQRPT